MQRQPENLLYQSSLISDTACARSRQHGKVKSSENLDSVPLNSGLSSAGKPYGGRIVNGKFMPHATGDLRREVDPTGAIVEHSFWDMPPASPGGSSAIRKLSAKRRSGKPSLMLHNGVFAATPPREI
jgi:hypothetical protein